MPIELSIEITPPLKRFGLFSSKNILRRFRRAADRMIRDMQSLTLRHFQEVTPMGGTGGVRGSWKEGFNRISTNQVSGKVFSRDEGSASLETGAIPHRPPVKNLIPWLRARHSLTGRELVTTAFAMAKNMKEGKLRLSRRQIYSKELERIQPQLQRLAFQAGIRTMFVFGTSRF